VWSYENGNWKFYTASGDVSSTLTTIEDGRGYWIYMNAPDTLVVQGTETPVVLGGTNLPPPPQHMYSLVDNDWNLLGFKSVSAMTADDYINQYTFKTLSNNSKLWSYINSTNSYSPALTKSDNLTSGLGYWLFLK